MNENEHSDERDGAGRRRVHPGLWIVLFFTVLIVLEASFFVIASAQPDDRIDAASAEPAG